MNQLLSLPNKQPRLFLFISASIWWGLYQALIPLSEFIVHVLPVEHESRLGSALQFFFYGMSGVKGPLQLRVE